MDTGGSPRRSLSDLPPQVTWEILSRLPIKAGLDCKLVCKAWHDTIACPRFARSRKAHGPSSLTLLLHCSTSYGRLHFVALELDKAGAGLDARGYLRAAGRDAIAKFKLELDVPLHELCFANACNGFVCFKAEGEWGSFYICNLLTSKYVVVEQAPRPAHTVCGYGLGFCPETRQHKILRFLETRGKDASRYVAEVQTLGSGAWRALSGAPQSGVPGSFYIAGPLLNGHLHWYCCGRATRFKGLWAFHLREERFLSVPTPEEIGSRDSLRVTAFDSCLCICCLSEDGLRTEVWLMREYGVGSSWARQFVVRKHLWGSPSVPLARFGGGKLLISCYSELALYDTQMETRVEVKVPGVYMQYHLVQARVFVAEFSRVLDAHARVL